jgi:hypothetical protein
MLYTYREWGYYLFTVLPTHDRVKYEDALSLQLFGLALGYSTTNFQKGLKVKGMYRLPVYTNDVSFMDKM